MGLLSRSYVAFQSIILAQGGSRFRQNFLKVARANIIAQAAPLAAVPILTRLYTPADFGAMALFASVLQISLAVVTMRFGWSVPNASTRAGGAACIAMGIIVLLICGTLSIVAASFGKVALTFWEGYQPLSPLLPLLPAALIAGGLLELLQAWHIRMADLGPVGTGRITQSSATLTSQAICGWLQLGATGLAVSSVLGTVAATIYMLKRSKVLLSELRRITGRRVATTWRRFWREASASTLVSLVNAATLAVIPVLLAHFFGATEVGWYALMYRLAITPLSTLTSAISQSFWAEAAQLVRIDAKRLEAIYLNSSKRLMWVAVPTLLVALAGPGYIGPILGDHEWHEAGYILAALGPMLASTIAVQPLTHLIVHRKQIWKVYLDASRLIALVAAISTLSSSGFSIYIVVTATSLIFVISYATLFFLNLICLRRAVQRQIAPGQLK